MNIKTDPMKLAGMVILLAGVAIGLAGYVVENYAVGPGYKAAGNTADKRSEESDVLGPPEDGEVRIAIENFVFSPAEITVPAGTKVTWINRDEAPHTATSTDGKFDSGGLDTGDKYSLVFKEKGEYQYICTLHPHMKATIKVN